MTWLDSAVGWISPQRGLRRVRARAAMNLVSQFTSRAYEGARRGRRTEGWIATGGDADSEIAPAMGILRARARDLTRNNPYAATAVKRHASNAVGNGIVPRSDNTVDEVWARWAENADVGGRTDFYGLQTLVVREVVEAGEALIVRRIGGPSDDIPFQLEVLEADFLDATKTELSGSGGGSIRNGIQRDAAGRRTRYWLYRAHPGGGRAVGESVPVAAADVLHVFDPLRAGQGRGVTWFAPVILKLRDLDDYGEAELYRKKIEACLAAFVETTDESRTLAGSTLDQEGRRIEDFSPGMVKYLLPGESVTLNQPSAGPPTDYVRQILQSIAGAVGLNYELLTGDLSMVNFSSLRAGLLEFRRATRQFQTQVLLPQLCLPTWRWVTEAGLASGAIRGSTARDGRVPVQWSYPKWESVQPLQDAMADLTNMRAGKLSLPEAVASSGYNFEDHIAEIVAANALLDQNGLIFDSDPRKVAKSGQVQAPSLVEGEDGSGAGRMVAEEILRFQRGAA